jgi:hypothetical protein
VRPSNSKPTSGVIFAVVTVMDTTLLMNLAVR